MSLSRDDVVGRYRAVRAALAEIPVSLTEYRGLTEAEFLEISDLAASIMTGAAGVQAVIVGETVHRSRPALGGEGLARRSGHRTVENFLRHTAGLTGQQAVTAVRAGTLLTEAADDGRVDEVTGEVLAASRPWLAPVAAALSAGHVSPSAAEVISLGLGAPNSAVTASDLTAAADTLIAEAAAGVHPDDLRRRARELRDELDVAGVAVREDERRAARALRKYANPDGGGRAVWNMDPETWASFTDFYDRAVSPKTHAARFVSPSQIAVADRIDADERTMEQLASDTLLQLLAQGMDADTSFMLGTGAPVIRITVAEEALSTGHGVGRIDGIDDPISVETVQRLACDATTIRIGFDPTGNILNLEREQRLFSRRQREALATKFGGCMAPGCNRPPSWCEAHHILQWKRDHGKTELHNGILLCKHHHLKYHNEHYEIIRDDTGGYWLMPPEERDPNQTPIPMPLKSRALNDLKHARSRRATG